MGGVIAGEFGDELGGGVIVGGVESVDVADLLSADVGLFVYLSHARE